MANVIVRRADLSDSNNVFCWRNDSLARRMAHSTEKVLWENHSVWFENSLSSENSLILICEDKTNLYQLGVVRFDFIENGTQSEISINLSPLMRGKGLAKKCLTRAISFMINEKPLCELVVAEIKKNNERSRKSFEGAGFKLVSEDSSCWLYQLSCVSR